MFSNNRDRGPDELFMTFGKIHAHWLENTLTVNREHFENILEECPKLKKATENACGKVLSNFPLRGTASSRRQQGMISEGAAQHRSIQPAYEYQLNAEPTCSGALSSAVPSAMLSDMGLIQGVGAIGILIEQKSAEDGEEFCHGPSLYE